MQFSRAVKIRAEFESKTYLPTIQRLADDERLSPTTANALREGLRMAGAQGGQQVREQGLRLLSMAVAVIAVELSLNDEQLRQINGVGEATVKKIRAAGRPDEDGDDE